MKFKKILLFLFITVVCFCGVISANALTISDDGKYTLILTSSDGDVSIDGASEKVIRFNVNEDETTVKLSELTKKIVPFNGKNEFAYWGSNFMGEKANEDIAITEFNWSGEVVGGEYTNGLTLYAIFSDKPLQGTGTYYITLDGFAGTINGEKIVKLTSKSTEFKTVDLTKYTPVREGYTFNGWNTKKDGSGEILKYVYWRFWDKENETDVEKDTLIKEDNGYERYKNVTLYASWIKNSSDEDTVKEIENTTGIKTIISFEKEVSKDYTLDIKQIDIKKELADKNIKFLVDINVLEGVNIVKINNIKMKIKIALPDNLKGYTKYEVVYIDNNEVKETIPAKVENGYIVFETSHLSQYGIVATSITNPNTSDNVISYIVISALTLLGLTVLVVKRNKQTI